ncbi:IPTL-CTERM sorting domain-containing protein [Diaphorobacter sp. HDW4A]|uniref:IPTL-CTERM sorting domain-containing protein n=1 Tax=Diaphorobacter sp. HDW4A TaxID=2714924 RepID=UPI00140DE58A|nr:IPTL-CTERM sorting domain-containing protein [Diaphorobacter sp. HDW4A]QIL84020.1 IPTL-CTERM sorting domain-containing protein [Diaphorobacter sp. HDW4A]
MTNEKKILEDDRIPEREAGASSNRRFRQVRPAALLALGALSTATSFQALGAVNPKQDNYVVTQGSSVSGDVSKNDGLDPANTYTYAPDPGNPPPSGLVLGSDGSFTYTPAPGATSSGFGYFLTETLPSGASNTFFQWVSLYVNSATAAAKPDAITIYQDELAFIPLLDNDLIAHPADPANVSVNGVADPANGTFQYPSYWFNSDVNLPTAYKPNAGFVGSDSFIYQLNSPDPNLPGNSIASFAEVSITVLPGSRPVPPVPVPVPTPPAPASTSASPLNDAYVAYPGYQLASNVTTNDPVNDPMGTLSMSFVDVWNADPSSGIGNPPKPAHAKAFGIGSDGNFAYEPEPGFVGSDSFDYRFTAIYDLPGGGQGYTNAMATVYITVPSRIENDVETVAVGQQKSSSVATNDQLYGMAGMRFEVTTSPTHGTLISFDPATGAYTFEPTAGTPDGTVDTFEYDLVQLDSNGMEIGRYKKGVVTITITASTTPPPASGVQPVPTLGVWGVAGLSALLAGGGVLNSRRRREKPKPDKR